MPDDVLRRIAEYPGIGGILRATSTSMRELVDASARSIHLRPHDGPSDLLSRLVGLREVKVDPCCGIECLGELVRSLAFGRLETLDLSGCRWLVDLGELSGFVGLRSLTLSAFEVRDLAPLAGCTALRTLNMVDLCHVSSVAPLSSLVHLRDLTLTDFRFSDISPLAACTALKLLNMAACKLNTFGICPALETLVITWCNATIDIRSIAPVATLKYLETSCSIGDLGVLASFTNLRGLNLKGRTIADIGPLARCTSLQRLTLSFCKKIHDLGPLAACTALQHLDLSNCFGVRDTGVLANLTDLRHLDLRNCTAIQDVGGLAACTALRYLDVSGCGKIKDIGPLSACTALQHLNITRCRNIEDVSPLSGIIGL
jgi:internalin A